VVASAALIAMLASVAVTGSAGSRQSSRETTLDPAAFTAVRLEALTGTATTSTATDPSTSDTGSASDGTLGPGALLLEPAIPVARGAPLDPAVASAIVARAITVYGWQHDLDESWYGPGFYGRRTACGLAMTMTLRGVASRTLPCGTLVTFRNPFNGATITVPVVDRGPYVAGRYWDLTYATCAAIGHCWTGPLDWRFP
jgi:rare lipoprotein A